MVGGGILSRRPGTLSGDGKLLLCPCGRLVHIYSAVTGERVGLLAGHTDEVTGVVLDPENDDQAYSCGLDATVRLWDYRSGEELRRLVVREPVKYMVFQKELGVAYFSVQMRERETGGRVMLYNMRTGKFSGNALRTRFAGPLALSPTGSLAATIDKHSLLVWRTGTDIYQPLNLTHTKPYTCLAISWDDSLIAAGDSSGRVLLWRSFEHSVPSQRAAGKAHPPVQPPLTTLHWHAHPVTALTFSPDGTYLLSGGHEGVLVFWQLDSNRKTFLPRLGGPLLGLHPSPADPAKYVVRQADNVVRIINAATMKVEMSVVGVQPSPAGLLPPPAGIAGGGAAVLAPGGRGGAGSAAALGYGSGGGGVLVLSCENSQLQFYDVARDRHLKLLQVAPRNTVSTTETAASGASGASGAGNVSPPPDSPLPPHVSHIAFSTDGSVLATVDVRPDAGPYGSHEACLKFWDSDGSRSGSGSGSGPSSAPAPFALNTRVDEPHRDLVASLAYHPHRHMAVTTGGFGAESEFKVWVQERRRPEAGGDGRRRRRGGGGGGAVLTSWRCRSVGGYKGLPMGATAFSADGSVLAVAAAARVTLWDAESNALAAVLPAAATGAAAAAGPAAAPPLTQLTFVPGTPFLAAASPSCLAVYNLLTAAVHWCLPLSVMSISADAAYGLLTAAVAAEPPPPPAAIESVAAPAPATPGPAAAADGAAAAPAAPPATAGKGAASAAGQKPQARRAPPPPRAGCHVVVFDPQDATPRYHCPVPGAAHVHIAHLQPPSFPSPSPSPSSSGGVEGEGCSPLLILRDSRQYSLAALEGTKAVLDTAGPAGPLERDHTLSAFEAAFGRPTGQQDAAPMEVDGSGTAAASAAAAPVGGRPRWAALFDAPSHALPPPTALAHAFLTLLTTSSDA